jgi:hypothetical protein
MPRSSRGQYPANWLEIAVEVKTAAGWKCIRCAHEHEPSEGFTLTVHHFDLDPSNNRWWNLGALCQRCHLRIQAKVVMERPWLWEHSEWFRPYVAGYYAYHRGLDDRREFVEANIDFLISLGQGRIAGGVGGVPITPSGNRQPEKEITHV